MLHLTNEQVRANLPWPTLIETLRDVFVTGCEMPDRLHYDVSTEGDVTNTFLLMPAWVPGKYIGIKTLTVFPNNGLRNEPAIDAVYLLFDGTNGRLVASMSAAELTSRRTAATSVVAASYLARPDASRLLIVGAGKVAHNLALAYPEVLPIEHIDVWNYEADAARQLVAALRATGVNAHVAEDLEQSVRKADVVSCATLSTQPLVLGDWVRPGTHIDLIGAFKPSMRETDDDLVRKAKIFVDGRAGALHEGGDLVQPLAAGVIGPEAILADVCELARKNHPGRTSAADITLFKSVGMSSEDLAAAWLAYKGATSSPAS